jgi:hypothetical protein
MQATLVYALAIASVVGFVFVSRLAQLLTFQARERLFSVFSKWALYTLVWRRPNGSSDMSVLAAAAGLLFLIGNVLGCVLAVRGRADLSLRLARLCAMNLVILFLGGRTSFVLDKIFRLSMTQYYTVHRWVGRISITEGILHGILNVSQHRSKLRNKELAVCPSPPPRPLHVDRSIALRRVWRHCLVLPRVYSPANLRDLSWRAFASRHSASGVSHTTSENEKRLCHMLPFHCGGHAAIPKGLVVAFSPLPEHRLWSIL